MTESDIVDALKKTGVPKIKEHVKHPAWKSFVRQMKDRQYGAEETVDAWLWFASGWDATY